MVRIVRKPDWKWTSCAAYTDNDLNLLLILGIAEAHIGCTSLLDIAHTLVEKFCFVAKVSPIAIRPSDRGGRRHHQQKPPRSIAGVSQHLQKLGRQVRQGHASTRYVEVTLFDIKSGSGGPAGRRWWPEQLEKAIWSQSSPHLLPPSTSWCTDCS